METPKIKIAIIATVICSVTAVLAFRSPDKVVSGSLEDLYWFQVEDGAITTTYLPNGPQSGCDEPSGIICAVALDADEGQVDVSDPSNPQPLTTDPFDSDTRSHRQ